MSSFKPPAPRPAPGLTAAQVAASKGRDADAPLDTAQSLTAHARALDLRLRTATQLDRQTTRRAAAHIVGLARRLSAFLARNPTLLPFLPPSPLARRTRHHVLHVLEPEAEAEAEAEMLFPSTTEPRRTDTELLTLGTNGSLRVGTLSNSGPMIWREYDAFAPPPGWDIELVLGTLAAALQRVEEHVAGVESRAKDRSRALGRLMDGTRGRNFIDIAASALASVAPTPAPAPALPPAPTAPRAQQSSAVPSSVPAPAVAAKPVPTSPATAAAAPAAPKLAAKRPLFDRLRDR